MSAPKHTPGPWQRSGMRSRSPEYKGHGVGPDGDVVVVVPYNDADHAECMANAHLIAAAPDLLDACIEALSQMRDYADTHPSYKKIADAIAKAEGRS